VAATPAYGYSLLDYPLHFHTFVGRSLTRRAPRRTLEKMALRCHRNMPKDSPLVVVTFRTIKTRAYVQYMCANSSLYGYDIMKHMMMTYDTFFLPQKSRSRSLPDTRSKVGGGHATPETIEGITQTLLEIRRCAQKSRMHSLLSAQKSPIIACIQLINTEGGNISVRRKDLRQD